jgi:class 3 adenylate cyclase
VICSNCGTQNSVGAKFCQECASPLAVTCPNCGTPAAAGAKFCSNCATPLGAAAGAPPAVAAGSAPRVQSGTGEGSERKLVSVLFADLVGFTTFAEGKDSEDVRDTLSRYFDLARDVIGRYGGTVEKFIGDAVMAVWGAPTAHEDDAERAVRAAMELVDAVTGLGPGIQARAGVLTGEAAVTLGATNQGMVAGDLVNTASRLQSVAPPGSVLVGESTQRAAGKAIAFEPAGEQTLKGKEAPIAAWKALRIVAELGGRNRASGLEPPFIGRQDELRLLKDLFHATGREKKLRVVSVIGVGGIGKSRLAWEFSKYLDGLIDDVFWHSGRSPAYGEAITFWALGEMVRERCGLVEADDQQTTRDKVHQTVEQWVTDPEERTWIEASLLTLLGVESALAADQLFGAWRTFFERIAEKGTVALVFEDMHFADPGLLDFIDHLLDFSRGLPIYVVTLARPDLIEKRQQWGAGKRNFVSLYLEPLPDEQMRELLGALVPGMPGAAVAAIVDRADGIPLYAVETVRMLVSEGRLVEDGGVYVPRGDLTTLAVPETLQALIASRLDGLDETERRLVHDAAVLGQSFSVSALGAVAEVAEAELEPRLASLVRRELLTREMDARSAERGQYAFVQALIREVAYNTLSKKDRKKLHLSAARYFESLGNDELAGVLASHYLSAHANASEGEEAAALAGQARIALKAAATRAAALGSFDQSVTFCEQALSVTTDAADRAELLMLAAVNAFHSGQLDRAAEMGGEAADLARSVGDRELAARATARRGSALLESFLVDQGLPETEAALAEFADVAPQTVASLRLNLARAHLLKGEFAKTLAVTEQMLGVGEPLGLVPEVVRGFIIRANGLWSSRRRREAFALAYAARDLAAENGLTDSHLRVLGNLAGAHSDTDAAEAVAIWRDLLSRTRKLGYRGLLLNGIGNLGYAAFVSGDWDEALAEADAAFAEDINPRSRLLILGNALIMRASRGEDITPGLEEMRQIGSAMSGHWTSFVADPEASFALASGDLKTARAKYTGIFEEDPGQVEYSYRAGRAALWAGDIDDARSLAQRTAESGAYGPVAEARLGTLRAGIAAREGRTVEALALYRDALRNWRETHSAWDEALTGVDMAVLLDPSEPEVAAAAASSRAIFERLRAAPFLARLDEALARSGGSTPSAHTTQSVPVSEPALSE